MKNKLIDLYKDWMKRGRLPEAGLCNCLEGTKYNKYLDMFEPTTDDYALMEKENLSYAYWGSGLGMGDTKKMYVFTPLRQTIVLFICAMNDEI